MTTRTVVLHDANEFWKLLNVDKNDPKVRQTRYEIEGFNNRNKPVTIVYEKGIIYEQNRAFDYDYDEYYDEDMVD